MSAISVVKSITLDTMMKLNMAFFINLTLRSTTFSEDT
ncbi:hypothetical protein LP43_0219 [Methylophaga thiooxydans]|uniref:Uncharacterized protein n=1 Tax=Methylophaga thiooxydans TaxID=392484 RepID=A0A0A0BH19_9GAMM|nr:hypothetical protein LP43_0219 [Methylophaga thiooxydans]